MNDHIGRSGQPLDTYSTFIPTCGHDDLYRRFIRARMAMMPLAHELVAQQAHRHRSDLAVVCGDARLTYGELISRVNSVARDLHRLGAGPERPVALCMSRSIHWITGMLAILRVGAAYLPLDPVHPPRRLMSMVSRARAGILLVEGADVDPLRETSDCALLEVDAAGRHRPEPSSDDPPVAGAPVPDNAAYMIYTSGSTGRPKAVVVTHRSLSHFVHWLSDTYPIDRHDNVMQLASIGFDASVFEVFLGLTRGATLHIASDTVRASAGVLRDWIRSSGITVGSLPPVLADSLFDTDLAGLPLRLVFTGSDWVSRFPPEPARFSFVNTYGPTEATVFVTADLSADAHRAAAAEGEAPGCGVPIPGTSVLLLDQRLNPVARGETGEIYLAGEQLARGYLNDPARTAERFIANPFGPGDRMFRTGDLGRWRPDGDLEFAGRTDTQVKIHGMRVELGEIEAVLRRHPRVLQAVVTAEGAPRPRSLIAHVSVLEQDGQRDVSATDLREHLAMSLPHYMWPVRYQRVARWPLNSSGKIDRAEVGRRTWEPLPEAGETPPQRPEERAVAEIWAAALGRHSVGRNDNFFALGGSSLLVGQVLIDIERRMHARLPMRDFFRYRDLAECAAAIRTHSGSSGRLDVQPRPTDGIPLSCPQRQVWFLDRVHPGNVAYNFSAVFRLDGQLDVPALEQSLRTMLARHEIYRTAFRDRRGVPYQEIADHVELPLDVLDVRAEEQPDTVAAQYVKKAARTSFDLTRAPLIRWTLLRLADNRHLLHQVEHHFVHDGWSFHVFLRELLELYRGFHAGTAPQVTPSPIQFADFACWQHHWLTSDEAAGQLEYWRRQLRDCPPSPSLPTDRRRPPTPSLTGERVQTDLPPWLCRALRELGGEEETTLYVVMLTVFLVLLQRYSGDTDIVVGSSAANRHRAGSEHIIGMLVNDLVLRVDLSGYPTLRSAVRRVREVVADAHANQDYPFEKLVSALRPDRDLSHNPFYQVSFDFHHAPRPQLRLPELVIELDDRGGNGSAKFDLTVVAAPRFEQSTAAGRFGREDGVELFFEYAADLFDRSTVHRMVQHYRRLLEEAVAAPDRVISQLPLEDETPRTAPSDLSSAAGTRISELVEQFGAASPDRTAVSCGEARLTYAQLVEAFTRIARQLGDLDVGPGDVVGLCVERSVEMVAGLLGILHSGAAYLPLDAALPASRLAFMLADSGARFVVTDPATAAALWPDRRGTATVALGRHAEDKLVCLPVEATRPRRPLPRNTAYLIYTSGSTGRPKSVAVSHENISALLESLRHRPGMSPADVMSALTTISFDISAVELLLPLGAGASVAVARDDETYDPRRLAAFLDRHGVTTMFATPDVWQALVESGWQRPGTRGFCGGEPLPGRLAAALLERGIRLWNMYGPTETTIMCLLREVTPADTAVDTVGLGVPPQGVDVHVLDDYGNPTPVGVVGELCVTGAGVGHGYLGRPRLTAERFVANWRGGSPGGRLYRTGDLARRRADGDIEFVGRRDTQVKLRGHRVELGEIESALARLPAVSEAVVVLDRRGRGKTLVAYVRPVPGGEAAVRAESLREALRDSLPPYMIPGQIEVVPEWPRTSNGKIDRRALPAPRPQPRADSEDTPRTAAEVLVATVWARVLGVPRIGAHDNFLDIGGNSLSAVQVAAELRELDLTLSPRSVLEHPTVAELARDLSECCPQELERSLAGLRADAGPGRRITERKEGAA